MATLDLRRSLLPIWGGGRLRFELEDEWRESWFCIPALIVAAAARETEDDLGEGEPVARGYMSEEL